MAHSEPGPQLLQLVAQHRCAASTARDTVCCGQHKDATDPHALTPEVNSQSRRSASNDLILVGLELAIFGPEDQRLIR